MNGRIFSEEKSFELAKQSAHNWSTLDNYFTFKT